MTYIEFFDKVSAENISACLTYAPDRVILIGNDKSVLLKHIENYKRVFGPRGKEIEFIPKTVSKSNLENAVRLLSELIETYDDCVFDITGGEEILNVALGVVYSRYAHKNIQIHKFNLRNNVLYDCDKDGKTIFRDLPYLTVKENINIYGGDIVFGDVDSDDTYRWQLDDDFLKDIEPMWQSCKQRSRCWNGQINTLGAAAEAGTVSADGLTVTATREAVEEQLATSRLSYKSEPKVIEDLLKKGLLKSFYEDDKNITVTYKNKQVKRCLTKAGQALEMKAYIIAKNALDDDGKPVYNDVMNGVVIDWDGKIHDEKTEKAYDTENEIDVMLMHNVVPVFISCKNGFVTSDELYKLETAARRFGASYAKKVLLMTSPLEALGDAGKYLHQRATDMGIQIIDNAKKLTDGDFYAKFRNLWRA